jgi:hypothetical protein
MQPLDTSAIKLQAITLRRSGKLYSEISKELGIAKSTVRLWTREIVLDKKSQLIVSEKLRNKQLALVATMAIERKEKTKRQSESLRLRASQTVAGAKLSIEHQQLLCAVMFWCEGSKAVADGIRFINSDPVLIAAFLSLLRSSFTIDESKFRAILHLHDYHNGDRQLEFWSSLTRIPKSNFYKPYVKPHTGKNTREGYPGCISVRYADATLGKQLKMVYSEFSKTMYTP